MTEARRIDDIDESFDAEMVGFDPGIAGMVGGLALILEPKEDVIEGWTGDSVAEPVVSTTDEKSSLSGDAVADTSEMDAIQLLMRDIGKFPLLTAEKERELGKSIAEGKEARALLAKDEEEGHLTLDEYQNLQDVVNAGSAAWETFISANYRLVLSRAKVFARRSDRGGRTPIPILDFFSAGYTGLQKAVDNYDWRRGFKFSTYAVTKIDQAMQAWDYKNQGTIYQPRDSGEMIDSFYSNRKKIEREYGPDITNERVVEILGLDSRVLTRIAEAEAMHTPLYLNTPLRSDVMGGEQGDIIPDGGSANGFEKAEQAMLTDLINQMLAGFDERDRTIMKMRFGFIDNKPMTYEAIGKEFGLTRESVRQIEGKLLAKLRHPTYQDRFGHLIDFIQ